VDFDVTSTSPALAAPDFDVTSTSPALAVARYGWIFDLTVTKPELAAADHQEDEALPNLDDLIFDVTSVPAAKAEAAAKPSAGKAAGEDAGMEFTLDFRWMTWQKPPPQPQQSTFRTSV